MPDILTPDERSERMRRIHSTHTGPEIIVRRMLFKMGYRYRLHPRSLPGRPDIVFPGRRKIIFVHGCFWHKHKSCRLARLPKSKLSYWAPKLDKNAERDAKNQRALRNLGWRILVVWECQLKAPDRLSTQISKFLEGAAL